ncbi:unnamed protein product [Commensalibacter communis]|nr:unnamed protein product [Commensalibacter communis]CAI3953307.1 unnamed protein product [Commensalibacter communis]
MDVKYCNKIMSEFYWLIQAILGGVMMDLIKVKEKFIITSIKRRLLPTLLVVYLN